MEKELELLEKLLLEQDRIRNTCPEKAEKAERKYNMLIRIAKLVRSESINMEIRKKAGAYSISEIAQKLLNESAALYVLEDADSPEVIVMDSIHRKTIAKFKLKIVNKCLMITEYQFF